MDPFDGSSLTPATPGRNLAFEPNSCAIRGKRGTHRRHQPSGANRRTAVGHFRVRARQLTPSAFYGSALLAKAAARCGLFLFRATRRCDFSRGPTMQEGLLGQIKRFVVGEPIPSHLAHHERLSRVTGLAVLSSDPLSSVAYATEEILRILIL